MAFQNDEEINKTPVQGIQLFSTEEQAGNSENVKNLCIVNIFGVRRQCQHPTFTERGWHRYKLHVL